VENLIGSVLIVIRVISNFNQKGNYFDSASILVLCCGATCGLPSLLREMMRGEALRRPSSWPPRSLLHQPSALSMLMVRS